MNPAHRRPHLPAVRYLDKANRVDADADANAATSASANTVWPTPAHHHHTHHQYPPGPPPPYTQPHSAHNASAVAPGPPTPLEPIRWKKSEDSDTTAPHSLPSIAEALGVDPHASYVPPTVAHENGHPPPSPSTLARPSYTMEPLPPNPHYAGFRQDSTGPPVHSPSLLSQPSKHARQPPPPPPPPAAYAPPPSPAASWPREPRTSLSGDGTQSAAPFHRPYGYTAAPPRHETANPPSSHGVGPIYQSSALFAGPRAPSPVGGPESEAKGLARDDRPYSDSIKRHLEFYDLEAALSELGRSSRVLMEFVRHHGDQMHQNARTEPTPATLPTVAEVDGMMRTVRLQLDGLANIREVVLAQHAAHDAQMTAVPPYHPPDPSASAAATTTTTDDPVIAHSPAPAPAPAFDAKKPRRGRAAPPGRCHSCNRAETPEWRRGPDGARTLCNACGLHFAKTTRKLTGTTVAAGATAVTVPVAPGGGGSAGLKGSNLRPKAG